MQLQLRNKGGTEMEEKWWQSSVVYQIYPRSFYDSNQDGIGDIPGIIEKLDYLAELGIDVIWLNPVFQSPNVDNGYDISDYEAVNPEYGTMEDLRLLIKECRERGIKVILDLVVNHTSDQHVWFQEAKKSADNPYHDYYIWRKEPNDLMSNFGGSAWEYVPEVDQYYLHFYSSQQPDLNWENPRMRQDIYKMMNFWIHEGIGGFRMDVIDLIGKVPDQNIKENGPHLHEYLQEMARETYGEKDLLTVGETWGAAAENAKLFCDPRRKELSMIFQFEQINLDKVKGKHRWDLKELDLIELKDVLSKWQSVMENNGWNSLFWNNHDLPRIVSRWGNDHGKYRVLSAKMLAILLHGMKGTPYIYQGEEIGMTNFYSDDISDYPDIETQQVYKERLDQGFSKEDILRSIHKKARDNGRTPMQWSQAENAGFTKGVPWMKVNPNYQQVNAADCLEHKDSIFYTYQTLIRLRKESRVLRQGTYRLIDRENPNIFSYERILENQKIMVICNFYQEETKYEVSLEGARVLTANYPDMEYRSGILCLRAYEAVMLIWEK